MREDPATTTDPALPSIGSLFSGYGGLDLAVEHVFNARTVWFSEISPVQRVFAHHWPDAPNLGDITAINWGQVPPVDILCGGFPCQDVSTVGKMAGIAPGTRSGLWPHMADAIDHLRPELVVIENVRGLLSATAVHATLEGAFNATLTTATVRNLASRTWDLGDGTTRPLRALGAILGDLADLRYDAQWVGIPASDVGAPHPRFRIFILAYTAIPNPTGFRRITRRREPGSSESTSGHHSSFPPNHRPGAERSNWLGTLEGRIGDTVVASGKHLRRWGKYASAIARWEHITGREAPMPSLLHESGRPRPAPYFLEWLMGLESGWATNPDFGLSGNQQVNALGNGVLPLQAITALRTVRPF